MQWVSVMDELIQSVNFLFVGLFLHSQFFRLILPLSALDAVRGVRERLEQTKTRRRAESVKDRLGLEICEIHSPLTDIRTAMPGSSIPKISLEPDPERDLESSPTALTERREDLTLRTHVAASIAQNALDRLAVPQFTLTTVPHDTEDEQPEQTDEHSEHTEYSDPPELEPEPEHPNQKNHLEHNASALATPEPSSNLLQETRSVPSAGTSAVESDFSPETESQPMPRFDGNAPSPPPPPDPTTPSFYSAVPNALLETQALRAIQEVIESSKFVPENGGQKFARHVTEQVIARSRAYCLEHGYKLVAHCSVFEKPSNAVMQSVCQWDPKTDGAIHARWSTLKFDVVVAVWLTAI
eukprot:c15401_g1_i2.p1 GENE.c15401_g1_i2~~c15401_g1_i2.p1  ORF type:complete len:354 (+),score=64.22 c15401_g1_i2:372-1433(+)